MTRVLAPERMKALFPETIYLCGKGSYVVSRRGYQVLPGIGFLTSVAGSG
jgi:hypothetical protein